MVAVPPLDAEQMCPFPLEDAELSPAVPLVPAYLQPSKPPGPKLLEETVSRSVQLMQLQEKVLEICHPDSDGSSYGC